MTHLAESLSESYRLFQFPLFISFLKFNEDEMKVDFLFVSCSFTAYLKIFSAVTREKFFLAAFAIFEIVRFSIWSNIFAMRLVTPLPRKHVVCYCWAKYCLLVDVKHFHIFSTHIILFSKNFCTNVKFCFHIQIRSAEITEGGLSEWLESFGCALWYISHACIRESLELFMK